jgi:hypothetical protein
MVIPSVPGDITTTAGFWNGVGYTGPATGAILSPYAVAVDTAGNIYIADGNGNDIRRVSAATGNIATVAGNGTLGYSGDGGLAINAELKDPSGIALDAAGNIYIADSENAVIRKVTAATAGWRPALGSLAPRVLHWMLPEISTSQTTIVMSSAR